MPGSCSSRLRKSAQDDKWSFCLTASYDLQDYSIVNLAFPQRSQTGPGAVPDNINLQGQEDNIYLQGQEDGVVYSLVWNPAKIKAMLCEIVRKQNGDQVPKINAANPYLSPLMKEDEYMPSTTLADSLTPLLVANPFSAMRTSLRWWSSDEFEDGVAHGW